MRLLSSMVEQSAVNRSVVGSSPIASAIYLARWRSGLTHIPFKDTFMGSNPVRVTNSVFMKQDEKRRRVSEARLLRRAERPPRQALEEQGLEEVQALQKSRQEEI